MIGTFTFTFAFGNIYTPAEINAKLDSPIYLQYGQKANILSDEIQVTFLNVTEDSRCPTDVNCIWQGRIEIRLSTQYKGKYIDEFSLAPYSDENLRYPFYKYSIQLIDVKPYPVSSETIQVGSYTAIILVSKHDSQTKNANTSDVKSPLKQFKAGVPIEEIKCTENLITILKKNGKPACVKPETAEKLIERRWATFDISATSQPIPENLIDEDCPVSFIDKTKYKQLTRQQVPEIAIEPESPITSWGELFSTFEEAQKYSGIIGLSLPTNMPDCLKLDSIRSTTGSMGEKFLTIVYLLEGVKPSGYYTLTNATEQGLTIQIIRDSAFVFQYNDDYVKTQAQENKNLGWNFTKQGNFPVLLKNKNAEFNMPSEVNTIINHQLITIRSYILEINELEKIFRSMFG